VEGNAARLTELFFRVNGLIALASVLMLVRLPGRLANRFLGPFCVGANNCTQASAEARVEGSIE
jgi:hypothetical protein